MCLHLLQLYLKSSLDRFIELLNFLNIVRKSDLKSSLDRFIDIDKENENTLFPYLKSSLDRFIETLTPYPFSHRNDLKSSLDRFIGGKSRLQ